MTVTVNKQAVQAFVAALRSGEYKQGRRTLTTQRADGSRQYCCLGVACVVARDAGVDVDFDPEEKYGFRSQGITHKNHLPEVVMDFYGFTSFDPYIRIMDPRAPHSLIDRCATLANDDYLLNFDEIADGFERAYLADADDAS